MSVTKDGSIGSSATNSLIKTDPLDFKLFREETVKNSTIIMGRKTYDSLRGKDMSDRVGYVLTRNPDLFNDSESKREDRVKLYFLRGIKGIRSALNLGRVINNYCTIRDDISYYDASVIGGAETIKSLYNLGEYVEIDHRITVWNDDTLTGDIKYPEFNNLSNYLTFDNIIKETINFKIYHIDREIRIFNKKN